ncbi:MAG: radical SAM family heme chaperone HemW [Prosthecochloris sp.]|jgi:oxygen-independent coproporphyrinogen III oxidase|nr:radical SAM family heme chaperone HemW [Prosthecochloris sp.]
MLHCYVHIPFCRKRCSYCDFFLVTRKNLFAPFAVALEKEVVARSDQLSGKTISSLHFGGGTPSVAGPGMIEHWLELFSRFAAFSPDAEITLEANPEDLSSGLAEAYAAAGVNRLSLGVQSYQDRKLRALGREHDARCASEVTQWALESLPNTSVDLICGAEGETLREWMGDLEQVCAFGLPHVSVYMLTVEPGTLLGRDTRSGKVVLPSDECLAEFYLAACQRLAAQGFEHYEVSNFCRPGAFSRYNLGCWHREPYLGFGPSAHSLIVDGRQETRCANVSSIVRYIDHPGNACEFCEKLDGKAVLDERIFLSLRLRDGVETELLYSGNRNRALVDERLGDFTARGWLEILPGRIRLTSRGFLFADYITEELLP